MILDRYEKNRNFIPFMLKLLITDWRNSLLRSEESNKHTLDVARVVVLSQERPRVILICFLEVLAYVAETLVDGYFTSYCRSL